jgi:hypothetical protein
MKKRRARSKRLARKEQRAAHRAEADPSILGTIREPMALQGRAAHGDSSTPSSPRLLADGRALLLIYAALRRR